MESQPLKSELQYLKGVGPERSRQLHQMGLRAVEDMIYFFPRRYEDRSRRVPIKDLEHDARQLVQGIVTKKRIIRPHYTQPIFRLEIKDKTGSMAGIWFKSPYLEKTFEIGQSIVFFGKTQIQGKTIQMIHPDYEILQKADAERVHTGRIVPFYALTKDLYQRTIRSIQYHLLIKVLSHIEDPLPGGIAKRMHLVPKRYAIKNIHFPSTEEALERAYKRLVFDEFFMIQMTLGLIRKKRNENFRFSAGEFSGNIREEFESLLPFELTQGQNKAIGDIESDMRLGTPMNRLIQGDVGSGKTTVAAFALLAAIRSGYQGAMMAPTEILAQQHYLTLGRLLSPAGIQAGLLTQGQSDQEKERILRESADGNLPLVVGTHALIQRGFKFKNLGLTVVDEQHKFGVLQRQFLKEVSAKPSVLVMTATPIPRTLALTLYGDLDISLMADLPKGRGEIKSLWMGEAERVWIYERLDEELEASRQAYIVYPAVEKSTTDLKSAVECHAEIQERFPKYKVGLLHGKMKGAEKKKIMEAFSKNQIHILVATTVIEVGLDVKNASFMVIENSERFGLSQLHQLRGRVGRGSANSYCIAISDTENSISQERLKAFVNTGSGFDIAEEDLRLRGPGDYVGTRQHGLPELRIGDMIKDLSILEEARREAASLIEDDPELKKAQHRLLKAEIAHRFKKNLLAA